MKVTINDRPVDRDDATTAAGGGLVLAGLIGLGWQAAAIAAGLGLVAYSLYSMRRKWASSRTSSSGTPGAG